MKRVIGLIRNNWIFILILLGVLGAFCIKEQNIKVAVASNLDMQVKLGSGEVLTQKWQANVKKIDAVDLVYSSSETFDGTINLTISNMLTNECVAQIVQEASIGAAENGNIAIKADGVKLKPGQQYEMSIWFKSKGENHIMVGASSNHGGCQIDGADMGCGSGLIISGLKTNPISYLVLVLFPFLAIAFCFMMFFDRKFEDTIGVAFLLPFSILYIAGMLNVLVPGLYMLYVFASIAFGIGVYKYNKNATKIKDVMSWGFVAYMAVLLFIIVNCNSLILARSDEFGHWGMVTKDMFYYDSFINHVGHMVPETVHYPVFMPLIQYFFVYVNGFLSDSFIYMGYQVVMLGCLVVICSKCGKSITKIIASVSVMIMVLLLFYEEAFSTLYVDAILTVFVAYVMICYFTEEASVFNWIRIISGFVAITYTKPTGAVLSGLIILMMLGDIIISNWKQKKIIIKKSKMPVVCLLVVGGLFLSWHTYLQTPMREVWPEKTEEVVVNDTMATEGEVISQDEEDQEAERDILSSSGMSIDRITRFLTGNGDEYQYVTLKEFGKAFLIGNTYQLGNIWFSYSELLLLFGVIVLVVAKSFCDYDQGRLIRFGVLAIVAGLGYAAFILVTYLFAFNYLEAMALSHHQRYLGTWLCGMALALGALVLQYSKSAEAENRNIRKWVLVDALCILLVLIAPTDKLIYRRVDEKNMSVYATGYQSVSEVMRSCVANGDEILYVYDGSEPMDFRMFQYAIAPLKADSFKLTDAADLNIMAQEYDYIFVLNSSQEINEQFNGVISTNVEDGCLYQVECESGMAQIELLGKTIACKFNG